MIFTPLIGVYISLDPGSRQTSASQASWFNWVEFGKDREGGLCHKRIKRHGAANGTTNDANVGIELRKNGLLDGGIVPVAGGRGVRKDRFNDGGITIGVNLGRGLPGSFRTRRLMFAVERVPIVSSSSMTSTLNLIPRSIAIVKVSPREGCGPGRVSVIAAVGSETANGEFRDLDRVSAIVHDARSVRGKRGRSEAGLNNAVEQLVIYGGLGDIICHVSYPSVMAPK